MRVATIRACSGCAGDYEDPDATAWTDDVGKNDEGKESVPVEEFPARGNERQEGRKRRCGGKKGSHRNESVREVRGKYCAT